MTIHASTVAFSGIDCLDIDVQVANGLPAFTIVRPFTPQQSNSLRQRFLRLMESG